MPDAPASTSCPRSTPGCPGYWEITIDAQVGAVSDSVVYKFCIQA